MDNEVCGDALTHGAHMQGVVAIAQHPTAPFVFSAALDGVLRQWDIRTGVDTSCSLACSVLQWPVHASRTLSQSVVANVSRLAHPPCTAGQCLQSWTGHAAGIQALVPSPDGQMILTGSDDGTARIFSVGT